MSNEDLFKKYVPVVEEAITSLGVPVENTRTDSPYRWSLNKGSSNVLIMLKNTAAFAGNKGLLVILSPFMQVPQDVNLKNAMMAELLAMNHNSSITTFSIANNGWVYLTANRFVVGMDKQEILDMLQEIGTYSDYFDDKLKAKYGGNPVDHNSRR